MLTSERQNKIYEIILNEGKACIGELAEKFGVSGETIRRDIKILSDGKDIKKVRGGAICGKRPLREESYSKRINKNLAIKEKLGEYAAKFIEDNDIIAIDSGATNEFLAKAIFNVSNITVLTNSLPITMILIKKKAHGDFTGKIIFLGGEIKEESESAVGMLTNDILKRFYMDKAFIGATTITKESIMFWDMNEGIFTSELVKKAAKTYLILESSKFYKETFYEVCKIKDIEAIVTDDLCEIKNDISTKIYTVSINGKGDI